MESVTGALPSVLSGDGMLPEIPDATGSALPTPPF